MKYYFMLLVSLILSDRMVEDELMTITVSYILLYLAFTGELNAHFEY